MAKRSRNDFTIEELRAMSLSELDSLLTPQEWAFVQARLEGLTRRCAYKKAYPKCRASDRVVDSKAYVVGKKDVVRVSFERHLADMKKDSLNAAFLRGQRATKGLEDIAYGDKKFKFYKANGKEYERYPSLSMRFEAMKELRRDSLEMIKNESAAENGVNTGVVTVVIKGFDEE